MKKQHFRFGSLFQQKQIVKTITDIEYILPTKEKITIPKGTQAVIIDRDYDDIDIEFIKKMNEHSEEELGESIFNPDFDTREVHFVGFPSPIDYYVQHENMPTKLGESRIFQFGWPVKAQDLEPIYVEPMTEKPWMKHSK